MNRRAVLAGVPTALSLGGCTDLFSDDEVTFEADTAVVPEPASSEVDYEEQRVADQEITREYDEVDRTVVVVNRIAEYSREVGLGFVSGELARFTVLATPKVSVGPLDALNPVDDMDDEEVAEMVQEEYDSIESVEPVDERETELLGETVGVTKFDAEAQTQGGQGVDVYLHVGQVESGDDFVLAIGVHPQDVDEQAEQDRIDAMMAGVEHPVEGDGGDDGATTE